MWQNTRALCILVVEVAYVCGQTIPAVDTSVGQIIGIKDEFTKFLGIPYAVVDVMDPFGPAKPATPFQKPYEADKDPPMCPQFLKGISQGEIQCINLNVYKPNKDYHKTFLPVMVYIHGGAFMFGDGNLNSLSPIFLLKEEVIVVTINYRLGPYGFLCLKEEKYNNQGFKDQSLALKWIKDNIKYFGGDINNVLLFGHSAGSTSVDFHMLSKEEKVFNKVILQSGQMLSPMLTEPEKNDDYLANLAAKLGIDSKNLNTADVIKRISNVDPKLVISTTKNDNFRPCLRNFEIEDPEKYNLKNMKIIIGNVEHEMILFYEYVVQYRNLIKIELKKQFVNISEKDIETVEKLYKTDDVKQNVHDFGNDFFFNFPTVRSMRYYLRNNATVYRYMFSYDGGRNLIKVRDGIEAKGATHGDELGYLYDVDILWNRTTDKDQRIIKSITSFWTNFAKYGDPNGQDIVTTATLWPKVNKTLDYYLDIGSLSLVKKEYRKDKMAFWDSFYEEFGGKSKGVHYTEESQSRTNKATNLRLTFSLTVNVIVFMLII